jgi:hypothetical protein
MKYYAYVYSYEEVPFYVGKGKGNRYNDQVIKAKGTSNFANVALGEKIRSILSEGKLPKIERFYCETEEEAYALEEKIITEIGRIDLGTGPLYNLTNGGKGMKKYIISETHREAIRKSNSERELSEAVLKNFAGWNKGIPHSEENKAKISAGGKGKKRTPEQKENYKRAAQNRTPEHCANISKALRAKKEIQ